MDIKISVIVSAYNAEKYIGRCIRSLLDQTAHIIPHNRYEIIVINDGSEDQTKFAIELFQKPNDSQITIINNNVNLGLPASLNKGINISRGNYIVRVDADDYVNSNFLSTLALYLDLNESIGAIACDYLLVDKDENTIKIVSSNQFPIACGVMFRKEKLIDVGMYNPKFRCNEDKELMMRFSKKYKLHHLNLPLYRYRRHKKNMTNDLEKIAKYDKLLNSLNE